MYAGYKCTYAYKRIPELLLMYASSEYIVVNVS